MVNKTITVRFGKCTTLLGNLAETFDLLITCLLEGIRLGGGGVNCIAQNPGL